MLTRRLTSHAAWRRGLTTYSASLQQHGNTSTEQPTQQSKDQAQDTNSDTSKPKKKSTIQTDEELRQKMAGLSGDGGEAGIEYEDGQPVAMKRGVKNNMFRYI